MSSEETSEQRMPYQENAKFKYPPPVAKDMRDKKVCVFRMNSEKKLQMEEAVHHICVTLKLFNRSYSMKFKRFMEAQVRGNMYALIGSLPLMGLSESIKLYWNTYNWHTSKQFVDYNRDCFSKYESERGNREELKYEKKTYKRRIALPPQCMEKEATYLDLMNCEPFMLKEATEKSNNNCWYIDYALDKVLIKAYKNVTGNTNTNDHKAKEYKDLSGITLEELLKKIKAKEDMKSINNYVDRRLAKMLPHIKNEIISTGFGRLGFSFEHHFKRLGLRSQNLKTRRKLYYLTIATQKSTTELFMNKLSVVATYRSQSIELQKLLYHKNIISTTNVLLYKKLLEMHKTYFLGHKIFVLKTFPEDDEPELTEGEASSLQEDQSPAPNSYMEDEMSLFEATISEYLT